MSPGAYCASSPTEECRMSQYEARLERDLSHIRGQLASLAEAVQTALETASLALFASDHELAYGVCLADQVGPSLP
mgnify:FL=1